MFEKISGFFKQFGRRRKRQSGETTIMEAKEPAADEFGLDSDFGDLDTFGDTEGAVDTGEFVGTADLADTSGFGDLDAEDSVGGVGGMSNEFEAEPRIEDEFADFDLTSEQADNISTGGTDFDELTISDEKPGATEAEFGEAGGDFADAFAIGEEGPSAEGIGAKPKGSSAVKGILVTVGVFIVAVAAGAAFQIYAWPTVGKMVGLVSSDKVVVDPQIQLTKEQQDERRLTGELATFQQVGSPEQIKTLKAQIADMRKTQGAMKDFKEQFAAVKEKEAAYDALTQQVASLEADIRKTRTDIGNVRSEITQAKQKVIELARETEKEYERFSFELARAELGQRLLIELQIQDIASLREDVAELENRLTKLSAAALISPASGTTPSSEASAMETSEN